MAKDKQGRVMYSFYIKPAAKQAVSTLAQQRGEPAAETLRKLLALGLQHSTELDAQAMPPAPGRGPAHPSGGFAAARNARKGEK